ncbi:hypothetical protein MMC14_010001 [Varicellaria rhodocarpa]|nr:hypothetical protein [Varicellaria rhodocarpa]
MSFKRCSSSPSPESTSPYDAPIFKKPRLEATEITPALYYILESLESDVNGLSYEKMVLYVTALHEAYQEQAVELASAQRELKHASEVQANLREMSDVMESKLEKQSIELASTRKDLEVQKKLQVLRDELATFRTELENVGAVKTSKVQGPTTSAGEIRAKVHEMADTMGSEIRKQMKWHDEFKHESPSHESSWGWQYQAKAPNLQVLHKLFQLSDNESDKVWKAKKISLKDFERIIGQLTVSTPEGIVKITEVEVSFNKKKNFSVTGLYGV